MSLFVDYEVQFPEKFVDLQVLAVAWCNVQPVLAVSTDDGTVRFFQDNGEFIESATYRARFPLGS